MPEFSLVSSREYYQVEFRASLDSQQGWISVSGSRKDTLALAQKKLAEIKSGWPKSIYRITRTVKIVESIE